MKKIAVVGTGVSGLVSAWILSQEHEVTLYEKNDYIGGHTNTRPAQFGDKTLHADTGFMVFNHRTYPNMVKMFEYLEIETIKTDMAFGVSADGGRFEFSSDDVFVQKRNICNPAHWKMILDIIRFNRDVTRVAEKQSDECTVKDLLREMRLGKRFKEQYLLPMSGEIWSTDKINILEYPAKKFVTFFNNHGLLSPTTINPFKLKKGRLQWYTVKGGSQQYVDKIIKSMKAEILLSRGVSKVMRTKEAVLVVDTTGESKSFDCIVLASHPDQTLSLLETLTADERAVLEAFIYNKNIAYMHKDVSFMMKHAKKWPSWTYTEADNGGVEISYYMNRLQMIDDIYPIIVTLNPTREIDEADIFYREVYEHPRFSINTSLAQEKIKLMQGQNNTWFAGAWLGYGFHEDGLQSALIVGQSFGITPPWEK